MWRVGVREEVVEVVRCEVPELARAAPSENISYQDTPRE